MNDEESIFSCQTIYEDQISTEENFPYEQQDDSNEPTSISSFSNEKNDHHKMHLKTADFFRKSKPTNEKTKNDRHDETMNVEEMISGQTKLSSYLAQRGSISTTKSNRSVTDNYSEENCRSSIQVEANDVPTQLDFEETDLDDDVPNWFHELVDEEDYPFCAYIGFYRNETEFQSRKYIVPRLFRLRLDNLSTKDWILDNHRSFFRIPGRTTNNFKAIPQKMEQFFFRIALDPMGKDDLFPYDQGSDKEYVTKDGTKKYRFNKLQFVLQPRYFVFYWQGREYLTCDSSTFNGFDENNKISKRYFGIEQLLLFEKVKGKKSVAIPGNRGFINNGGKAVLSTRAIGDAPQNTLRYLYLPQNILALNELFYDVGEPLIQSTYGHYLTTIFQLAREISSSHKLAKFRLTQYITGYDIFNITLEDMLRATMELRDDAKNLTDEEDIFDDWNYTIDMINLFRSSLADTSLSTKAKKFGLAAVTPNTFMVTRRCSIEILVKYPGNTLMSTVSNTFFHMGISVTENNIWTETTMIPRDDFSKTLQNLFSENEEEIQEDEDPTNNLVNDPGSSEFNNLTVNNLQTTRPLNTEHRKEQEFQISPSRFSLKPVVANTKLSYLNDPLTFAEDATIAVANATGRSIRTNRTGRTALTTASTAVKKQMNFMSADELARYIRDPESDFFWDPENFDTWRHSSDLFNESVNFQKVKLSPVFRVRTSLVDREMAKFQFCYKGIPIRILVETDPTVSRYLKEHYPWIYRGVLCQDGNIDFFRMNNKKLLTSRRNENLCYVDFDHICFPSSSNSLSQFCALMLEVPFATNNSKNQILQERKKRRAEMNLPSNEIADATQIVKLVDFFSIVRETNINWERLKYMTNIAVLHLLDSGEIFAHSLGMSKM